MSEKNKIVVILGPTASGKSDFAVKLAKKFNGEIISADSRQVYKGLDIGTGKITKKEMKGVKHYLLDVADPIPRHSSGQERFNASDYKKLAEKAIGEILAKGKIPIICGGTGFYIDALLGNKQIPEIPPNEKLREKLEKKSAEELFKILQKLDLERAKNIDAKNPRRLVRAIEICKALEKVPPLHQGSAEQAKYKVLKIGIAPIKKELTHPQTPSLKLREGAKGESYIFDEKTLKNRINKRLEKRVKQGMILEAKNLHRKGLSFKRMRELGLEYGALAGFLEKKITKKEMVERLQKEIWHYAKRQMTWFKKDKNIIWLRVHEDLNLDQSFWRRLFYH